MAKADLVGVVIEYARRIKQVRLTMYYPDELVEEVRSRNDIVDIVGNYVRLQKKGASYFGLCPFHNEKSPSFSVSPQKQMYYCFGCGAGGNVFTFLMNYEKKSTISLSVGKIILEDISKTK